MTSPLSHAPRKIPGRKRAWLIVAAVAVGGVIAGSQALSVEQPKFTVTLRQGAIEVRDYPAAIVAEVTVTGDQTSAVRKGFRLLAGYIFGGNTRQQSIAMTAPVAQTRAPETIATTAPVTQTPGDGAWLVRFTMPARHTLTSLPRPNDPRVTLREVPPARLAVIRFSGLATPTAVAARTTELATFVTAHHLTRTGPPTLAQYDPPWTLWFLRHNEVMMPVAG